MRPLVSVVVLSYNQKGFLRESIESVLDQTYANVELVVADDGSADGSRELLIDFQRRYPRALKLALAPRNAGITANSNRGLAQVKGEFVAWLGGDDTMHARKLERQVDVMLSSPQTNVIYHDLAIMGSDGHLTGELWSDSHSCLTGDARTLTRHGCFNGGSSTLVRMSSAPGNGFDSRVFHASDWLYWVECLLPSGRIEFMPEVLGAYRVHAGGITKSRQRDRLIEDHLVSCAILRSKFPEAAGDLRFRESRLLRSMADAGDRSLQTRYLRAAQETRWTTRIAIVEALERTRPGLSRIVAGLRSRANAIRPGSAPRRATTEGRRSGKTEEGVLPSTDGGDHA